MEVGVCLAPRREASAAGPGVVQLLAGVGRGLGGLHVAARADARIRETLRHKLLQRRAVEALPLRLHVFLVPVEAEPSEVADSVRRRAWLVLGVVQILHPEDHLSAEGAGAQPRDHEGADVAEVESPRRTRRKPADVAHLSFQYFVHSRTKRSSVSWSLKAIEVAWRMSFVATSDFT